MLEIVLSGVQGDVRADPDTGHVLITFADPKSGITVGVPLNAEEARQFANALAGRPVVQIAKAI